MSGMSSSSSSLSHLGVPPCPGATQILNPLTLQCEEAFGAAASITGIDVPGIIKGIATHVGEGSRPSYGTSAGTTAAIGVAVGLLTSAVMAEGEVKGAQVAKGMALGGLIGAAIGVYQAWSINEQITRIEKSVNEAVDAYLPSK